MYKFLPLLLFMLIGVGFIGWLSFVGFALFEGASGWFWYPHFSQVPAGKISDAARSAVTALATVGGVFAVVYAYRKQRIEEAAGHRSDAEQLSKRYQDAAKQIGDDKAAVRLAGVYAMARLADEWPDERQTCVNVLSGYLRMPQDQGSPDGPELEVRSTICSLIREHLQDGATTPWFDLEFDFRRATLVHFNVEGAVFRKPPNFGRAVLEGACTFRGTTFCDGAEFISAVFKGPADMQLVRGRQQVIAMDSIEIAKDASLRLSPLLGPNAKVRLDDALVKGSLSIELIDDFQNQSNRPAANSRARFAGQVSMTYITVDEGASIVVRKTQPGNHILPKVTASDWRVNVNSSDVLFDQRLVHSNHLAWHPGNKDYPIVRFEELSDIEPKRHSPRRVD
jgi:hypothetical protein